MVIEVAGEGMGWMRQRQDVDRLKAVMNNAVNLWIP
jgi:hypothetical protein